MERRSRAAMAGLASAGRGGAVAALAAGLGPGLPVPPALDALAAAMVAALRDRNLDPTARRAIELLGAGVPPGETGRRATREEPGAGALCLGTAVPVGLAHVESLRGIADDAASACRVLHDDPRCVAACRAVAMATALLVQDAGDDVVERASLLASPSPAVRRAVETGAAGEETPVVVAVAAAFAALADPSRPPPGWEHLGPDLRAIAGALVAAKNAAAGW